ncbi:sensor histidine kinase [Bacillus sp. CHD6a]|uniref:sensor histidine kinase n=1 Tax=Bacillus sp. CHD6a TaxID=1643452 RepID=UPI000AB641B0|nr:GHKL domain-containing protein [Bacillus sp. CHD6a]
MKTSFIYSGALGVLLFLHLHALFGEWISFFVSFMVAAVLAIYFHRKIVVEMERLGWKANSGLWIVQVLVVTIALGVSLPPRLAVAPMIVFVVCEYVRITTGQHFIRLQRELAQHEEQRAHINETFRIVRSERHDFLKHVSAVHFMLENDKAPEAKLYLDDLVENYEETNYSIRGERGVVAGVLHQMYRRGKAAGVSVVYDLDLPLSTLPIGDQQIVGLLGNLLDNSLDACEEWQRERGGQAILTLQFYKRSGLYILICRNHTLPVPVNVLDSLFDTYGHTTKGGGHEGLGTKIMKDIVEEHQGFLDFVCKDEEFTVKIKIPAIR